MIFYFFSCGNCFWDGLWFFFVCWGFDLLNNVLPGFFLWEEGGGLGAWMWVTLAWRITEPSTFYLVRLDPIEVKEAARRRGRVEMGKLAEWIHYVLSRNKPGCINWIKVISSQAFIFQLWKYQKNHFDSVKITSDCNVTSCFACSVQ